MSLFTIRKKISRHTKPGAGKDRFTKTGKGHYGHDLKFLNLNLNTPQLREIARKDKDLSYPDLKKLLFNKFQQFRIVGIFILVEKFKSKNIKDRANALDFYLKNLYTLNNWDLVDSSAYQILGTWLVDKKDRKILYNLAKSKNIWERRVAIVSTFAFIRNNDLEDTYKITMLLINDKQDLIHKAIGWMLREAGGKDQPRLELFLKKHIERLPRTTLRYAIEKFEGKKRKKYLRL